MHPAAQLWAQLSQPHPRSQVVKLETKAGGGRLRRWLRGVFRRWQRRKVSAALHAMDDRQLMDIGIRRADIPRMVDRFSERELGIVPLSSAADTSDDVAKAHLRAM